MPLRLLIVDDSTHFLDAARTLLEREGLRVVATASTGADAVRCAWTVRPDVTLVDVDLGEESGLDLVRRLDETAGAAGRVVLTSAYSEADLRDLIDASPAVGFVPKSHLSSGAIRRLLDGVDPRDDADDDAGDADVSGGPGT
jgi:DNA-binding NarL/FixJ family response regulator